MSEKNINKNSYIWSHIAVIIFHIIYGSVIAYIGFKYIVSKDLQKIRQILIVMGLFLVLISSLSLVPILKKYDKIVIN